MITIMTGDGNLVVSVEMFRWLQTKFDFKLNSQHPQLPPVYTGTKKMLMEALEDYEKPEPPYFDQQAQNARSFLNAFQAVNIHCAKHGVDPHTSAKIFMACEYLYGEVIIPNISDEPLGELQNILHRSEQKVNEALKKGMVFQQTVYKGELPDFTKTKPEEKIDAGEVNDLLLDLQDRVEDVENTLWKIHEALKEWAEFEV